MPFRQIHPRNRIFLRHDSPFWQARFVSGGVEYVRTTGQTDEHAAFDWLVAARTAYRNGQPAEGVCLADGTAPAPAEQPTLAIQTGLRRVRCISLWQPWASLMAHGLKWLETRGWNTRVRGEVYIHAALSTKWPTILTDPKAITAIELALGIARDRWDTILPHGALVAHGSLYRTYRAEHCNQMFATPLWKRQELFGDFSPGRFAHYYANLKALRKPIPWKAGQRFFFAEIP